MKVIRNAGIPVIEKIAWGTHFYLFHETQDDLRNILQAYFTSGWDQRECCIWITADQQHQQNDIKNLPDVFPEADLLISQGKLIVVPGKAWFENSSRIQEMFYWLENILAQKRKQGASGLRIMLDFSVTKNDHGFTFAAFEKALEDFMPFRAMIMLCYYPVSAPGSEQVLDIVAGNFFVGALRQGLWQVIKSPGHYRRKFKSEITGVPPDSKERSKESEIAPQLSIEDDHDEVGPMVQHEDLTDPAINSLPGIFYLIDESRKYLKWNKNFEVITGYTAKEIERMDPLDFFPADHQHIIDDGMYMVFNREGVRDAEADLLTRDGRRIPFYLNGKFINYEGRHCLIGVGINITDLRRAEGELAAAHQRLSNHVENTPLAVVECDEDLLIRRWSKRAEEIFGWEASESLRKNVLASEIPIIYDDDRKEVENAYRQLIAGTADRNVMLIRNNTKEGKVIYCEWYNSILRDNEHHVITILSLIHDVTERKKTEQTLSQSYEEIRLLTRNLQSIREHERTRIARELHDELGQQLTVIKMDVSWLYKKLEESDDQVRQRIRELLDILDGTVKSVRRICAELRPSLLDDLGLVAAFEWHLKEFEKRSGIRTDLIAAEQDWRLPNELKIGLFRIFQESLTNIARHSGATRVQVQLNVENQHLILRIKDNGKGFDRAKVRNKKTLGLVGIEERSAMMEGKCIISGNAGEGTLVEVIVPFNLNAHLKTL